MPEIVLLWYFRSGKGAKSGGQWNQKEILWGPAWLSQGGHFLAPKWSQKWFTNVQLLDVKGVHFVAKHCASGVFSFAHNHPRAHLIERLSRAHLTERLSNCTLN